MGMGKTVIASRMVQWLLRQRRQHWAGERPDAFLVRIREGHALEVAPGTGIETGDIILLAYIPRCYQTRFWQCTAVRLEPQHPRSRLPLPRLV